MAAKCQTTAETLTLDEAIARLPAARLDAMSLLPKLAMLTPLSSQSLILDVGAAQGRFLIACAKMGYRMVGVEPCQEGIRVAHLLAQRENVEIEIVAGTAEAIPFPDEHFDVITAKSVMEHVQDAQASFQEVYRTLKPGGVFWFHTASSVCPKQQEIVGFPFFGWYPDRVKRRIMGWAAAKRPDLIGHASCPAVNWFTPWKARHMLQRAGFRRVYDRWQLPLLPSDPPAKRWAITAIRSTPLTRLLADVFRADCSYAAMK